MHVVVDMLGAVAVVAVALGAVAERLVGIIGVGLAADGAFVEIALLLMGLPGGLLEVHRLAGVAVPGASQHAHEVRPEEEHIVENGHQGHQSHGEIAAYQHARHGQGQKAQVQPGQPFGLDRDDEVDQKGRVRIKGGEGQEEGHVQVVHIGGLIPAVAHQTHDQAVHDGKDDAQKVVYGEFGGAPGLLQAAADGIVQQHREEKPEEVFVERHKNKGHQPPDLPLEDQRRDKADPIGKGIMAEQVQQQHDHVAHGDDQHQIGDAQLGVPVAETVQKRVDGFQRQFLPDQGSNVSLTGNGGYF